VVPSGEVTAEDHDAGPKVISVPVITPTLQRASFTEHHMTTILSVPTRTNGFAACVPDTPFTKDAVNMDSVPNVISFPVTVANLTAPP
jgi:hypothetical protein